MKEFVEKLIGRLEEQAEEHRKYWKEFGDEDSFGGLNAIMKAMSIVNQLAEEYKEKDCSKCSRRSWYQKGYKDAEKNNGWIPCEKELPKEAKLYEVTIEKTICSKKQYITDYRLFGTENEWISADKVIAWREKVEPYQKGE